MYVANSEPAKWQRGGGRTGVPERVLISGEPNRSEAGRDMGRQCDLTRGSPPVLALIVSRKGHKTEPRGEKPQLGKGQRAADLRVVLRTQGLRSLVTERRRKP
jgi:hypothetical protein